jgi:hypothetical protein
MSVFLTSDPYHHIPKAVGTPSQIIAHFGLVLHPFLFT